MINRTRILGLAAAMAIVALLSTVGTATAQGVPWNCNTTTICNLTHCPARLSIGTIPFSIITVNLNAGQCVSVSTAGITSIDRVIGAAGGGYPVLAPPPVPPCNCPLGSWSVCCVTLPPQNCCFDVCFDQTKCQITLLPAACPTGSCRP
ncbi:MAG: hypothetical protein JST22_15250 [Bacteroidetes bacterium]|nr:hypothetical protein [Bacteroidota bacterium]